MTEKEGCNMADIPEKEHKRGFFRTAFNFNVREWLAVEQIKSNSRAVADAYRGIFGRRPNNRGETFAEAVQRLGLTSEKLQKQKRNFFYFSVIYLIFSIGLLLYSFYLLLEKGFLLAFFVSFIMGILMLVYSFKEHFWYMQISKQKLGCTFKEWISFVFKRA